MTATKFITFGIGCVLLLPFIWCFVMMVIPAKPSPAEAAELADMEKMRKQAEEQFRMSTSSSEGGIFFGVTSMTSYEAVTPHPRLAGVWLLASRKWVGVTGLAASLVLLACLFISSFYPVIVSSYTFEHSSEDAEKPALDQAPGGTIHIESKEP